jgi:YVTN family beta-propeller protein
METDRGPFDNPLNLQESRKERRARLVRRRRQAAVGSLIALVVLAAVGYGIYALITHDRGISLATTTTEVVGQTGTSSGLVPETSAPAATAGTMANLAPQKLDIAANPEVVNVTITLQDGTTVSGKTPFKEEVPGGNIKVELNKKGYNTATRRFELVQPSMLKVWLDPAGQLVESIVRFKCGRGPQQLAFSPDGRELWVSLLGGQGLEVYNPTTGDKTGEVALGGQGAAELVFTEDGETLYATNMKTSMVYEIDRVSRTVKRRLATEGANPKVLVLSPDEKTLWTANWGSNDVSEIDLVSGIVVRRIPTVKTPRGLYVTSDAKRLYVGGYADGELQRIDLLSGQGTVVFKSGGALWHMAGDDALGLLYVDDNALGKVYVVDLTTEVTTELAATDHRPNTVALSPDGKVLYVANRGKDDPKNSAHEGPEWGSVLLIDSGGGTILDAIVGGNQCTGLAVSSDGALLAFSDFFDDRIRVYGVPAYATLVASDGGRAVERFDDIVKK